MLPQRQHRTASQHLGLEWYAYQHPKLKIRSYVLISMKLGKSRGITVNTVAPGVTPTDMSKPILEALNRSASNTPATLFASTRAAARLGTVEDIADAVLLLASEQSRWITAQWISVSGGVTGTM